MPPLFPVPSSCDFGNCSSSNSVPFRQKFLCYPSSIVLFLYRSHLIPCQDVPRILLSASPPSFSHHIVRIFSKCSEKQMCRIYANRVVAFVQDILTFRDWSIVYQITRAMRPDVTGGFRAPSHGTVAATSFSTCPNPARRTLFNLCKNRFSIVSDNLSA